MMNKTITFFLLAILGVNVLIAQSKEFPTTEATWKYTFYDATPSNTPPYHEVIEITGDTIINGYTYQSINEGDAGYYRKEDKQVYFLPQDSSMQDYLIYDFSWVEGDTIAYQRIGNPNTYDTLYVQEVDSILVNDGYRKRWIIVGDVVTGELIEGIGSTTLYNSLLWSGDNHTLVCFKKEDEWILEGTVNISGPPFGSTIGYLTCDGYISSTEELLQQNNTIKISPNPYLDQFEIFSPVIPKNTIIKIYSFYGQLIQTIRYQGQIFLPELPAGIYLLSFKLDQIQYNSLLQKL